MHESLADEASVGMTNLQNSADLSVNEKGEIVENVIPAKITVTGSDDIDIAPVAAAKVLVIDDDEGIRDILHQLLLNAGFDVLTTDTGEKGTNLCRQQRIDLVLVDMILPNKDGIETILDVRRGFPEAKFIAMSGAANSTILALAKKLGAWATLTKPFTAKQLLQAVRWGSGVCLS